MIPTLIFPCIGLSCPNHVLSGKKNDWREQEAQSSSVLRVPIFIGTLLFWWLILANNNCTADRSLQKRFTYYRGLLITPRSLLQCSDMNALEHSEALKNYRRK